MTRTRWIIALFWVFVVVMLVRQCNSNRVTELKEAETDPRNGHYFFTPPPALSVAPQHVQADGPDVKQIAFVNHPSTPGAGSFTCDVTLQNQGRQTARGVQVHVRPYRGVMWGSIDVGHVGAHRLRDDDPLSQYGTWLTFPDLKPGESATQSAVFLDHQNVSPGFNSNPEITFDTPK